jgi:hypothetical protein
MAAPEAAIQGNTMSYRVTPDGRVKPDHDVNRDGKRS